MGSMQGQRSYGGVSGDERAARRRRQLLDAGLSIFGSRGYRTATVREVCREAKVADRYFYDEFHGMEELLIAVYTECLDRLEAAVADTLGSSDALSEKVRPGLESFLTVVADDPRLARVVWFEVLGVSPIVEQTYLGRMARFGELLVGASLHPLALPRALEPLVGSALIGGISHVVMTWVAGGLAAPRDDVLDALEIFLDSVAARISPEDT
ncbi:Fatty acid metabolism regulator protein [Mycolicibacterium obuense]|uniref:Fatty acid metabolism regulator protein n=2 Tax=Mycolicibacterium obuense TaxID=1807 RepID=A0A0J6VVV1_9MYCO|nr:Fatty acid metabolism regulator protein [Mycolicibacterium obuense]